MLKDIISGFVSLFQPDKANHEDRRRVIRLRCRYSVYCIDLKEITTATVIDMGLQGLRLETNKQLKPGIRVSLVYRGAAGQRPVVSLAKIEQDRQAAIDSGVRCKVTWSHYDKFSKVMQSGVTYADTPERMSNSWVKKILREIGFDEASIFQRRKIVRVVSSIGCRVRMGSGGMPGRVVNMGAGGALLQAEEAITEGSTVFLNIGPYKKLEPLEVSGCVVTARFDAATSSWLHGCRFVGMNSAQTELLGRYVVTLLKEQT